MSIHAREALYMYKYKRKLSKNFKPDNNGCECKIGNVKLKNLITFQNCMNIFQGFGKNIRIPNSLSTRGSGAEPTEASAFL